MINDLNRESRAANAPCSVLLAVCAAAIHKSGGSGGLTRYGAGLACCCTLRCLPLLRCRCACGCTGGDERRPPAPARPVRSPSAPSAVTHVHRPHHVDDVMDATASATGSGAVPGAADGAGNGGDCRGSAADGDQRSAGDGSPPPRARTPSARSPLPSAGKHSDDAARVCCLQLCSRLGWSLLCSRAPLPARPYNAACLRARYVLCGCECFSGKAGGGEDEAKDDVVAAT